jgi:hypothetical protein
MPGSASRRSAASWSAQYDLPAQTLADFVHQGLDAGMKRVRIASQRRLGGGRLGGQRGRDRSRQDGGRGSG